MRNKHVSEHCQEVFILNQQYKSILVDSDKDHNIQTYCGSNYVNFMSLSLGENSPDS